MCGITGFITSARLDADAAIGEMCNRLSHRGPDDSGHWADPDSGVVLGHRRLSILDLSALGHQPMRSPSGRFVVVYNGEIYNFRQLAEELRRNYRFRGGSDTEVLLAGFEEWGVEETLRRCNGMFAIAVWDCRERLLTLARDRLGEKPLYFGWGGGAFLFGSELKGLLAFPEFAPAIDRSALALFMEYSFIPAPWTIFENVYKLLPGTLLSIDPRHVGSAPPQRFSPFCAAAAEVLSPREYWSACAAVESGRKHPFAGGDEAAIDGLERLLCDSVQMRMISDVPLGAFLSGGIDSATVVAIMKRVASGPVRTFSIGFENREYDEAQHARRVAAHLGTEHHEHYVSAEEALDVVRLLPSMYDEPFADPSQIPTYLVSKMARSMVTVALSGDGGDELFGGYSRYDMTDRIHRRLFALPFAIRGAAASVVSGLPPAIWHALVASVRSFLPASSRGRMAAENIWRVRDLLASRDFAQLYATILSVRKHRRPESVESGHGNPFSRAGQVTADLSVLESMMFHDLLYYLPDDILAKVDRASMCVSLEGRIPLLDHRIVEFAWSLPLDMRVRGGTGKWLLKQVLRRYVPWELVDRPKMGFGVPVGQWLRGPLKSWAEEHLEPGRLREGGYLDSALIRESWERHQSGKSNNERFLWNALMFQAWLAETGLPAK